MPLPLSKGRRRLSWTAVVVACLLPLIAFAQGNHITHMIVAFPPGGPVDLVGRTIADELGRQLDQRVVVDNKPGANGTIGAEAVIHAPPDGTTLLLASVGAVAINPALYPSLPYDVQKDLAPVSLVVNNVEVLVVSAANPARDAKSFIAAAKAGSSPVTIASSGVGSMPHLAMEQLASATQARLLHVPYKGAAPAITDVIGGQVSAFFGDIPGLITYIRSGRLRAIGIAAEKRSPLLPEVPTLTEQGIAGVQSNNWYALFAPAKTPQPVLDEITRAVRITLGTAAVRDKLLATGSEPMASTQAELAALVRSDTEKWTKLIRDKNITAE